MTTVKVNDKQAQAPAQDESIWNVLRLTAWNLFLVKAFVHKNQLRTLVGREIVGIAPHQAGGGRSVPVYDVDKTGWLGKGFTFEVPMAVNADGTPKIHDLSCRVTSYDKDKDEVEFNIESSQVMVWKDAEGVFQIKRIGYGEMIEHFGGTRLKKGDDGVLTEVSIDAEPEAL